jgi:Ca-activated chloride channel homolog
MPGRHAAVMPRRTRRRSGWGRTVGVVCLSVLVPIAAFVGVREFRMATNGQGCTGTLQVEIAAAPEISGPLKTISAQVERDKVPVDGACLSIVVTASDPRTVFERVAAGTADLPDLWVPDTWEWVARTGIPRGRLLSLSPSVATSPLVLATSRKDADALAGERADWATLARSGRMALGDAEKSGIALSALLGIRRSVAGDAAEADRTKLGTTILRLAKERVDALGSELDRARRSSGLRRGVPATEQQVLSFGEKHPEADIVATAPKDGTVLVEYPLVAVVHKKPKAEQLITAGVAMMRYVNSTAGQSTLRQAGFRDYRDESAPRVPGNVGKVDVLPPVTLQDADEVLRSWAAMSLDSKLLAVVDVSGSMVVAAGDRSRIELARDATNTALSYFPDKAEVGLWEFADQLDGPRPYRQLAPVAPLSQAHRDRLTTELDELPEQLGQGTGLYDTIVQAYLRAKGGFDPARVNSLVVLTDACSGASRETEDCRNEVTTGRTIEQALNSLESAIDPAAPVSVILVGIGAEADLASLERIAEVTDGYAYRARNPDDMEGIIIDSLLRRQCGKTCS